MVIKIGSFPLLHLVMETMWLANKSPLKSAYMSPTVIPAPVEAIRSVNDTSPIPAMHNTAAEALNLSGRVLFTIHAKKGTITQYDADKKALLPGSPPAAVTPNV